MGDTLNAQQIVAEILAGHHTDFLPDIYGAVLKAAEAGNLTTRWRIRYDGLEITEDTFTVGECLDVENSTGQSWAQISPAKSAHMATAVIAAALKSRKGLSSEEARQQVKALPAVQLVDMVDQYVVEASPLEGGTVPFE